MFYETLNDVYADQARKARVAEIERELIDSGVKHVYFQYVTLQGRVNGKVVPTSYWLEAANKGMNWSYITMGGNHVTMNGDVVGSDGGADKEGLMLPDLDTFAILPWDTRFARVYCTHYRRLEEDVNPGQIADGDSRALLQRALRDLKNDFGLTAKSGCEPEMSWFKGINNVDTSRSHFPGHIDTSYHLRHVDDVKEVLVKVTEYAQQLGFDMIQADYESASQLEINFQFDDFLATADRLMTYRQICVQVASELDMYATFMPKPVAGIMANGCHHHVSFWKDGKNAMVDESIQGRENFNDLGRQAIGGLLQHSSALMAIFAPTVNSYKRYLDANYSPTAANWGYDNRLCAFRVVPGRVEVRTPDASVNPYLSHLAILAAVRDGWEKQIDPGAAQDGGDTTGTREFSALPMNLGDAVSVMEKDPVVMGALGPALGEQFIKAKRDEWMRYCGAITQWDFDNYLAYTP